MDVTYSVTSYAYADDCNDPNNWRVFKASDGKCYQICDAGGIAFEVDCGQTGQTDQTIMRRQTVVANSTAPAQASWLSRQDVLRGVPNWIVLLGGVVIVAAVMNN